MCVCVYINYYGEEFILSKGSRTNISQLKAGHNIRFMKQNVSVIQVLALRATPLPVAD